MAFWLADSSVKSLMEEIRDKHHPHLLEARIAILFSDKRKVSGNKITLGTAKKVSDEDKVLSHFDFKIVLSAEDWADLTSNEKEALLDHELSHCDVMREPVTETIGGKRQTVKDKYGRTVYSDEIKVDEDTGRPKWKIRSHDFENFAHIAERYGLKVASMIGGYFPVEAPPKKSDDDTPPEAVVKEAKEAVEA